MRELDNQKVRRWHFTKRDAINALCNTFPVVSAACSDIDTKDIMLHEDPEGDGIILRAQT